MDASQGSSRVLTLTQSLIPPANSSPQTTDVPGGLKRNSSMADLSNSGPGGKNVKRRFAGRGIENMPPGSQAGSSGASSIGLSLESLVALSGLSQPQKKAAAGYNPRAAGNFQLNYDYESPVRSIDVGGSDQQLRMAEFVTRSINNECHGVSVKDAMKRLSLQDGNEYLPGLEVRLLPHQLIGVAWMVEQELNRTKGGILADDMGLGKTVQMMAMMAMNLPDSDEPTKTTLIVVPAALLQQWKDEIETKTNGLFNVHLHYGREKLKTKAQVRSKDVIITTYQTLNMDFAIPKDIEPEEELTWLEENGGLLSRVKFYRAVCDEAQFIRNRSTRSSQSVAMIKAKYRWTMTGTPITNTLADIYGLLRFGRFRPWNDWSDFHDYIAKTQIEDAVLAGDRAREVLRPLMLRRTKDCKLEGKPILELPPKDIELVTLEFSPDERALYDDVENKSKIRVNRFIRNKTLVKNHAVVLVMILRLRQLCCHPNLILSEGEDYDDPSVVAGGSKNEKESARAAKVMGVSWVTAVKKRFLDRALALEDLDSADDSDGLRPTCPSCHDLYMHDGGRILGCGHEICFECLLNLTHAPVNHDGEFGQGDEQENTKAEKEFELSITKGYRPCPVCKRMMDMSATKAFKSSAFEPTEEELSNHIRVRKKGKMIVRKLVYSDDEDESDSDSDSDSKDKEKRAVPTILKDLSDSEDDMPEVSTLLPQRGPAKDSGPISNSVLEAKADKTHMDRLVAMWRKGDEDLEPSTKMAALIELLKEWDASGDKTIIFSQWTSMLDLVEILFSRHGIRSLRYDGKMDKTARDATLAAFRRKDGMKVILVSTKCGGVGLNLVSANRIINLDLSWNYAAESQAYDRVHRLGQEKDVFIKRLVVKDTIEERMLKLQDVKMGLTEAALGEGTGGKLHKLSIRDIQHLFGMTKEAEKNTAAAAAAAAQRAAAQKAANDNSE